MDFGKLPDVSMVDFTLPPDSPATLALLRRHSPTSAPQIYLGCTGWGMKEWVGTYYPAHAKPNQYLHWYAQQFNTIELNTTHYQIPNAATVADWYEKTSDTSFRFAPKVPQSISHSSNLLSEIPTMLHFCDMMSGLRDRLGVSFMQMPPTFAPQRLHELRVFLEACPVQDVPLAIELRHEQWFKNIQAREAVFDLLESMRVGTVLTDVAGRRDVLHQRLTTPVAMVRFVGNSLHQSDYARLDAWLTRLQHWVDNGLQTVYFFLHQPDNAHAPAILTYFAEQIQARTAWNVQLPKRLDNLQFSLF